MVPETLRRFLPVLILPAFVLAGMVLWPGAGKKAAQERALAVLAEFGFAEAIPTATPLRGQDAFVLDGLRLDPDGFSTAGPLFISLFAKDRLLRRPAPQAVIDGLALTGTLDRERGLSVAGWTPQALPVPAEAEIVLKSGKLDLATPAGGLRLEARGTLTRRPDGTAALQAALWSVQNQAQLETAWKGRIYPDGRWAYDVDFENGALALDSIQAARVSGWLSVDRAKSLVPAISGQIDAGKVTLGGITLTRLNLALNGPLTRCRIVVLGQVAGYEGMTLSADIETSPENPALSASITTPSATDLLAFLDTMGRSDNGSGRFTSLLLTRGNLDRLGKILKTLSYDSLDLKITGAPYDLAGKIVARTFRNGVEQNHVISLNPGNAIEGG